MRLTFQQNIVHELRIFLMVLTNFVLLIIWSFLQVLKQLSLFLKLITQKTKLLLMNFNNQVNYQILNLKRKLQNMTAGEFVHVTEFYETVLTVLVSILVGTQMITVIFCLSQHLSKSSLQAYKDEEAWLQKKTLSKKSQVKQTFQEGHHTQLEKQVANYVQNMEKIDSQQKDKQQQIQHNHRDQDQLPSNKEKYFKLHRAFNNFMNEKMAILMPLLILGILTQSTYIYTLAAFFFSFLCEVLIEIMEVQQQHSRNTFNGRTIKSWLKIIEFLFVMSIFISYWAVKQFDAS